LNINEVIQQLAVAERLLESGLSEMLLVEGNTLCANIANRVIERGVGGDGQPFSPYSTKSVPAYLYLNRSRSGSANAKVQAAAKRREPVSYAQFRSFNNLPTDKKNFSFTNDMWRHFGVKKVQGAAGLFKITIGGTSTAASEKIGWLSEQEGRSIITPTQDELGQIAFNLSVKIQKSLV
jgi:hypothetical protein